MTKVNRDRRIALTIFISAALGALLLFVIVAGTLGSSVNDSGGKGDKKQHSTEAQPKKSQPKPQPKKPQPKPKPAAEKVLLSESGSGIKKTERFQTNGPWHLKYSYDCTGQLGGQGNFIVSEYSGGDSIPSDVLVNELDSQGQSTTPVYDPGQHYLDVNSECSWHVTVTGR